MIWEDFFSPLHMRPQLPTPELAQSPLPVVEIEPLEPSVQLVKKPYKI